MENAEWVNKLRGLSVYVSYPTHRPFDPWVVESLLNAQQACFRYGVDAKVDVTTVMDLCELRVARSQAIDEFYKSKKQILAFIDSDICFTAQEFLRMLWMVSELKCVAASYCGRLSRTHLIPQFIHDDLKGGVNITVREDMGAITWDGVNSGLGFFFATREVVEKLLDNTTNTHWCFDRCGRRLEEPYEIKLVCDYKYVDGVGLRGDDHYIFDKIKEAGFIPWIWPGARLGHVSKIPLGSCLADQLRSYLEPGVADAIWPPDKE